MLAYQLGDGLMNMIIPTNPVLMAMLGAAGIPYGRWLKFIGPLLLRLLARVGGQPLVVAVAIGYGDASVRELGRSARRARVDGQRRLSP